MPTYTYQTPVTPLTEVGETLQTRTLHVVGTKPPIERPLFMCPGEDTEMMEPEHKGGKNGAKGGKPDSKEEYKTLPTDPTELLQLQTFRNLRMMDEFVEQLSHLAVERHGPGEPGGSDPESSDSYNNTGNPKNRDGDPVYHARQKRKTKRAIKRMQGLFVLWML